MSECIFCKIIAGEIPCKKVYEDENVLSFYDINPSADVHVLVIPKKHIASLNDIKVSDKELISEFMLSIPKVAQQLGINSYKTLFNTGKEAGQTVFHIHAHILAGSIKSMPQ